MPRTSEVTARRDLLRWAVGRAQAAAPDAELVVALGSIELAFVAAYQAAIDRGTLSLLEARLVSTFAAHHIGHAAALQTLLRTLDRTAPALAPDDDLGAELELLVSASQGRPALMAVAYHIEQIAAATATVATERASDPDTVRLVAEVAPVESQHALVLASILGRPAGEALPDFETTGAHRLGAGGG